MTLDELALSGGHEYVPINQHMTFLHVMCRDLEIDIESTKGDATLTQLENLRTGRLDGKALRAAGIVPTKEMTKGGCTIKGDLLVAKVGGTFKLEVYGGGAGASGGKGADALAKLSGMAPGGFGFAGIPSTANVSHVVHRLAFGEPVPGTVVPLTNAVSIFDEGTSTGKYDYQAKVVPTYYRKLRRINSVSTYQYSVAEQFTPSAPDGVLSLSARAAPGVSFTYDFYPVLVEFRETKQTVLELLVSVSGLCGGVVAIARIVDGVLHQMFGKAGKSA